ncbi:hypothetical protein [Clostridium sp. DL-VIII]|uniref:hypothetical protein n=1 Tax=Clostridium sp. DL-VIII TaxID=641107 RepID=UPI00117CA76D|nr:hypothetical protein [Clostridium sp. DL-VIII]
MSREPKSMILCESLTQRAYASRASAMMENRLANGLVIYLIVPKEIAIIDKDDSNLRIFKNN